MTRVRRNFTFGSRSRSGGFSIVETLVASALLAMIAAAVYGGFQAIGKGSAKAKLEETALLLASEKLEIARDVAYKDLGIKGGLPAGKMPRTETVTRGSSVFTVTTTIRNVDEPFDGTIGGTPNDLAPADQKLVQVEVACGSCGLATTSLQTKIAPASGLETSSGNGALFVQVVDASGLPVPEASVHIVNSQKSPTITIDDLTANDGFLKVVDAPTGTAAYQISVTKSGYSSAQTYQPGLPANPVPTVPSANVVSGKVTQITFAIDRLATLNVSSVKSTCEPVGNLQFDLTGAKTIGLNVFKFDKAEQTNSGGSLTLPLEWDSYSVDVTDSAWALVGTNPAQPLSLLPGAAQPLSLVVASKAPNALVVKVRDASSLPIANASVTVSKAGYSTTKLTGQGAFSQTDWSGGPGQTTAGSAPTGFVGSDGNVDYLSVAGQFQLAKFGASYVPSGWLESSTFDAGTTTNFLALSWLPASQPPAAGASSARFQVATNQELTATTTWSYVGPTGSADSYFTSPGQAIPSGVAAGRYLRYKAFLATASATSSTPTATDVSATFTEQCAPAGQAYFSGLASGTYTVQVSKAGYQTTTQTVSASAAWQETTVKLNAL